MLSQELLFRGALLPLFGLNWKSALAVGALFGVLHLGNGRRTSFAIWYFSYFHPVVLFNEMIASHAPIHLRKGQMCITTCIHLLHKQIVWSGWWAVCFVVDLQVYFLIQIMEVCHNECLFTAGLPLLDWCMEWQPSSHQVFLSQWHLIPWITLLEEFFGVTVQHIGKFHDISDTSSTNGETLFGGLQTCAGDTGYLHGLVFLGRRVSAISLCWVRIWTQIWSVDHEPVVDIMN